MVANESKVLVALFTVKLSLNLRGSFSLYYPFAIDLYSWHIHGFIWMYRYYHLPTFQVHIFPGSTNNLSAKVIQEKSLKILVKLD